MEYDLIIRDGTVVDGSGLPRYRADVGIVQGRIAKVGKVSGSANEVIEADGHECLGKRQRLAWLAAEGK